MNVWILMDRDSNHVKTKYRGGVLAVFETRQAARTAKAASVEVPIRIVRGTLQEGDH